MKFITGKEINRLSQENDWAIQAMDEDKQYEYQSNGAWYRFKDQDGWTATVWLKKPEAIGPAIISKIQDGEDCGENTSEQCIECGSNCCNGH